jgi:dipeptidase
MCDTIVALKNSTKNSAVLFGKNSDREKIEPHIIIRLPRKNYGKGQKVKCTYIEIEQSEITYDCYLFKPSWIWGAEMGVNEFGVTAGNAKTEEEKEKLMKIAWEIDEN